MSEEKKSDSEAKDKKDANKGVMQRFRQGVVMQYRIGIGQDSHRFLGSVSSKNCVLGGIVFQDVPGFDADSDGDVVFHALCNAISSITHVPILGDIAIRLCHEEGITDSRIYLESALKTLGKVKIEHVALSLEGKKPRLQKRIKEMRTNIARILDLMVDQVGITVTSGDELTACGQGEGVDCFCIITTSEKG